MSSGWDNQNQQGGSGHNEPQYGQSPDGEPSQSGPSYGQGQGQYSPYGQGQYGQQQPHVPVPGPYSQPGQTWGRDQSLYGNPYAVATPPARRSDMLGVIGLAVVFVSTVVLVIVSWMGGQSFGQFILDAQSSGLYTEEDLATDPLTMEYVRSATGLIIVAALASVAGLAGWVTSIVATVQRRGRGFGVVGIILGVLSLGIAFATFFAGVVPVLGYN